MPFRSEKQRRYLWATNPEIARRWADEYPLNGKKLPMYAKDGPNSDDEKKQQKDADVIKAAKDILKRIKMPTNTGPTYAGQTDISSEQASTSILDDNTPKPEENADLNKCGTMINAKLKQQEENQKAEQEGRLPRHIPAIPGVRRQMVPTPYNPLTMPMTQPSANTTANKQANPAGNAPPVGPANAPTNRPIQQFGPIAANGNINGNAAFGIKNSPNSSKTSSHNTTQKSARISAPICPCGCGEKSYNCTCPQWCSCRNPGMPCAPKKRKTAKPNSKTAGLARALTKATVRESEEQGADPATALAATLLTLGAGYGLYHGGKKLLSPVARRLSVSTLKPDEVAPFSLPVAGGGHYPFAERYRQPSMLGSMFIDRDEDALSDALMHMSRKVPGSAARLEQQENKPSLEPGDLDVAGKYLVRKYPHRYRNVAAKTSAYKGITEFSGMPGPDQISHAVSQLGMLKALVRPDDSVLRQRGITRSGFQSGLRDIYNHSRDKDRFELSEMAPQPNTHAMLGGLGGVGAAGLLGYAGVRDPAVLAGTAVIPAVAAYFRARNKRHNLLNTAKLVKDYGLLRPKLLRQAYPLLAADD